MQVIEAVSRAKVWIKFQASGAGEDVEFVIAVPLPGFLAFFTFSTVFSRVFIHSVSVTGSGTL
jgi:hypothetical protein